MSERASEGGHNICLLAVRVGYVACESDVSNLRYSTSEMRRPTSCACALRDLEYLWQSTLVHQHMVFAAEFATMGRLTARMVATCRCRYTSGVNPSSISNGLHVRGAIIEAPHGYVAKCRLAVDSSNVMLLPQSISRDRYVQTARRRSSVGREMG